ncbi:cytochrome P450 [Trametes sanguinea]|nr:cytochrome P450 [Trametes sanguinea]
MPSPWLPVTNSNLRSQHSDLPSIEPPHRSAACLPRSISAKAVASLDPCSLIFAGCEMASGAAYLGAAGLSIPLYILWLVLRGYVLKSPLDNVPCPPRASLLLGNIPEIANRNSWKRWQEFVNTYGSVFKIHSVLGMHFLHVFDPRAMHSVLIKDAELYPKTLSPTTDIRMLLGPGLLTTDGAQNRKQRKLLNPVFSVAHLRNMTHIFYNIAHKLCNALEARVGDAGREIDVNGWMARTTLEMLGQAGLGYSFDNFDDDATDAYGEALKTFFPQMIKIFQLGMFIGMLSYVLPEWVLRKIFWAIPHREVRRMVQISDLMARRSLEIINEKRAALQKGDDALVHHVGEGKDIMSLLLKANMAVSEAERHTDEELVAQMSTLILGGMDTTSNALSRILQILAERPDVQEKLRKELVEASHGEDLAHDDLIKLPYLDAVCRETLRLHAPVPFDMRQANADTTLPLMTPIRGFDGTLMKEIPIPKGTHILLHNLGSNTNREIWGEDADEWKPERWLGNLPAALDEARIPGVYSHLMTFSGGGRSCIGFKFSQLEMKVILLVLLSKFKFERTEKPIAWNSAAVMYPTTGEEGTNPEMFLKVTKIA